MLGCGADHLLAVYCYFALRNRGGEIIEPGFSYHGAAGIVKDMAARAEFPCRVVHSPMTERLEVDLDAVLDKIGPRCRGIFLTNPNNPTGLMLDLKDINAWLKKIPCRVLVVIDEAYIHFCPGTHTDESLRLPARYPNLSIIRTFSKIYGLAGLRLGYAVGHESLLRQLNAWRGAEPGPLVQAAGATALDDQNHFLRTYRLARQFRLDTEKAFKPYGAVILPSRTSFILFQWKDQTEKLQLYLEQKGILVAPFYHDPSGMWIRASMGTPPENDYFISTCRHFMAGKGAPGSI